MAEDIGCRGLPDPEADLEGPLAVARDLLLALELQRTHEPRGARELIEEMYEHRHQRRFWNMIAFGYKLLANEGGGIRVAFFFALMHASGLADRWNLHGAADWIRRLNTLSRTEDAISRMLKTRFQFVLTRVGGCAIDVDTEVEYDAAKARFHEWMEMQDVAGREFGADLALPQAAGPKTASGE